MSEQVTAPVRLREAVTKAVRFLVAAFGGYEQLSSRLGVKTETLTAWVVGTRWPASSYFQIIDDLINEAVSSPLMFRRAVLETTMPRHVSRVAVKANVSPIENEVDGWQTKIVEDGVRITKDGVTVRIHRVPVMLQSGFSGELCWEISWNQNGSPGCVMAPTNTRGAEAVLNYLGVPAAKFFDKVFGIQL